MKTFKKIAKVAIPVAMVMIPLLTFAAVLPSASNPIGGNPVTLGEIENLINLIARVLIVISIVIAVIFITIGAIELMAAHGDATRAKSARDKILYGIYGAAVVFAIGIILQTTSALVTRTFFN